ncbi:MAG: heavy-metal-associated domain-containing protein [Bacteroidia bacterium]|nr:heavy-metal-associated domain-containing protein [Bacteroidia bacterium]MDW8301451.1 heavy metal-associated domain-containing protein [Bacteroidia bacterium]
MKSSTFITNITCERCVQEVSEVLKNTHWIKSFTFEDSNGKNYLKVNFHEAYSAKDIIHLIQKLGYTAKEKKSLLRFFGL